MLYVDTVYVWEYPFHMSEFTFDMFDLDLSDEELAIIFSEIEDGVEAGTWEGFEPPLPW